MKAKGVISREDEPRLSPADTRQLATEVYALAAKRSMQKMDETGDDDFSFSLPGLARFRVNVFKQRGSVAMVIRVVPFVLPDRMSLGIPDNVMAFSKLARGLVLVTGPAGSGKSTTLACLIHEMNETRNGHIITLEDPIEFLYHHNRSIVTQREISTDTTSYAAALKSALRQAPDVILLGEVRDYESISAAVTAAETGHLILTTLHTTGAANTVDRIIDSFPSDQQQQIRIQLSMTLKGIISQQLIPAADGGEVPAFEVMIANSAVRNLIRDRNTHQLDSVIHAARGEGMISMDTSLLNLAKAGTITHQIALEYAFHKEQMQRQLGVKL